MFKHSLLAFRLLTRDWHAGELKILTLAVIIAVASMTSVGMFTQRINRAMTDQAGQFLGADLILRSSRPIQADVIDQARRLRLNVTSMVAFSSVIVANDDFQLTHVKAVGQHYPLLSQVRIASSLFGNERAVSSGPPAGEVWLAPRALSKLGISIGNYIELGESRLMVSAVLKHDPGRSSSFMAIAPRLLMNMADLDKTGIIQPGSRVSYQAGFSGALEDRTRFEKWLRPQLVSSQRLLGGSDESLALGSAMSKAEQYLSLASMLSVMLSGIAIAMSANRYGQRHFDQSALMRCMGATQNTVIKIFSQQLIFIGLCGSLLGSVVGYLTQELLVVVLKQYLAPELPAPGIYPVVIGLISGFVTLTGFALPALLRLKSVSPLRVLRKDLTPLPVSSLFIYLLATGSIILLMWWQSGRLQLTLLVVLGVFVTVAVMLIMSQLLLLFSRFVIRHFSFAIFSGAWRTGLLQIVRHRNENQLQMLAFGLSLMILMIIFLLRTDLMARWQQQIPDQAPNHFVINIQQSEVQPVREFFIKNNIHPEGVFPMVRGRISEINGRPVLDVVDDKTKQDPALKRELNLSWAFEVQANNKVIEGNWWRPKDIGKPVISIEKGLAQRLQLGINDELGFNIAEQTIRAKITNIRSVQWDSFQPNFYIIFPDNVINNFPVTYITSFYIPKSAKQILNQLVTAFPTVTVLEIDAIMEQVRSMMEQVSIAIEIVMLFVLLAGITVLVASMQSSMDERIHSAVIMRTLGTKKSFLQQSQFAEYTLLGLLSGVLAVSGTELITYLLYSQVFSLDFELHGSFWLAGPVISAVLILFISRLYTRQITRQSPLKILRYS